MRSPLSANAAPHTGSGCRQVASGRPVRDYFNANAPRVADALLGITDEKAKRAKSAMVKGTYEKLRGTAKKNVEAAVPRLAVFPGLLRQVALRLQLFDDLLDQRIDGRLGNAGKIVGALGGRRLRREERSHRVTGCR